MLGFLKSKTSFTSLLEQERLEREAQQAQEAHEAELLRQRTQQAEKQSAEQQASDELERLVNEAECILSVAERAATELKQKQSELFTLLFDSSKGLKKPFHQSVQARANQARYRLANAFTEIAQRFRFNRSFEVDGEVYLGDQEKFSRRELAAVASGREYFNT